MAYAPAPVALKPDIHRSVASSGVAECLVDDSRRTVKHGLAKTDNPQHIPTRLRFDACDRAFPLKVMYHQKKAGDNYVTVGGGIGQLGLLRGPRIPSSPGSSPHYAVSPVTAKHNLRKIKNRAHGLYPADAKQPAVLLNGDLTERLLEFEDLNVSVENDNMVLRECSFIDAEWAFGIDISFGRTMTSESDGMTNSKYSFELAGDSYEFKVGQKVGIAVFNTVQPTAKSASPNPNTPLALTSEELKEIYGEALEKKVYAGKITLVGEHHVEYDINAFEGCSGAIVFLLDVHQHESVAQQDYDKAIGVHAGTHPILSDRNMGFKLTKALVQAKQCRSA